MHTHHSIDYIELAMLDSAKTKDFYSKAFGWEFTDYSPTYIGIKIQDREVGGFTQTAKVHTSSTLVVLYSKNLEESMQAVLNAGGTISKDIFPFPGGRRFQFLDPSGNELAVWSDR